MFRSVVYIKCKGPPVNNKNVTSPDLNVKDDDGLGTFFSSESWEKNKRFSEQAAAVVAIQCLTQKV